MERLLVLEDGSTYRGRSFGGENFRIGELVFNTSMTGYQEILTDNAYCGNRNDDISINWKLWYQS